MHKLLLNVQVLKELADPKRYPAKIYRQLTLKIFALMVDPRPPDSKPIGRGWRVDSGEYRIFYQVDDQEELVKILVVGPRNDDAIYKMLKRLGYL